MLLFLHQTDPGGAGLVFWHPVLGTVPRTAGKPSCRSGWGIHFPQRTDWLGLFFFFFFGDWNLHWRHLRKNPLRVPALRMIHLLEFPRESQLCTWMEFSFVYGVFFFFIFLAWTFAANGTYTAECWLCGSPCFFVNLNEKGGDPTSVFGSQTSAWTVFQWG